MWGHIGNYIGLCYDPPYPSPGGIFEEEKIHIFLLDVFYMSGPRKVVISM